MSEVETIGTVTENQMKEFVELDREEKAVYDVFRIAQVEAESRLMKVRALRQGLWRQVAHDNKIEIIDGCTVDLKTGAITVPVSKDNEEPEEDGG